MLLLFRCWIVVPFIGIRISGPAATGNGGKLETRGPVGFAGLGFRV